MSIIRRASRSRFTTVTNSLAQDSRLSFEARGVLLYLLSKPDDWRVQFADIEREGNFGRDKRQRIFAELEQTRYFERVDLRNEGGQFAYDYLVHEVPVTWPEPENPAPVQPVPEKPVAVYKEQNTDQKQNLEREEERLLQIFRERFPTYIPSPFQQDQIYMTVTDITLWTECCDYWVGNAYQPRSINKLLDMYTQRLEEKTTPSLSNTRVVIDDFNSGYCASCQNGFKHLCPEHKEDK